MLDDPLLDDANLAIKQLLEKIVLPALPVILRIAGNAHPAAPFQWLGDDVGVSGQKRLEGLRVRGRTQLHPAAPHFFLKQLIEGGLVIKQVPIRLVVHPPYDLVAQAARDLGFALRVVETVHLGDFIVHISGVVLQGAAQHVGQEP